MIEIPLTTLKLGMGDEVWTKKEFLGARAPLGLAMGVTVTVSVTVTKKFQNCRIFLVTISYDQF